MAQESRVKKSLLNARVNMIFYFLTLALSFFSRKIFLDCLGADFVGLTGTLQNLLSFLNLAELGIGSAIGYLLYKPLFDHDQNKINEIISVMGYLYRWIGLIILGGGIILSCFLPWIFPDSNTGFQLPLIYFAYYSFLVSSLIGYFINYRQNLLGADQRNYVVTAYFQGATIIKTIIQMALAYSTGNYYLWVAIELTFGIIYSFILNWKINQTYPWLKAEVKSGRQLFKKYPEVMKKAKQVYVHQLTLIGITQTRSFIIYAFASLSTVAYFMNYSIIIEKVFIMLRNIIGSVTASVGNLIAEGQKEKTLNIFFELYSCVMFFAGIVSVSIFSLSNDFVSLWLGQKYVLSLWVLMPLYIHIYFDMNNDIMRAFINGFGLFRDVWSSLVELALYLIIAITCGWLWGLFGVLLGRLVSTLCIWYLWKPYFLFHSGFKITVLKYWKFFIPLFSLQLVTALMCNIIINKIFLINEVTLLNFLEKAVTVMLLYSAITFIIFYFLSSGFRNFIQNRVMRKYINRSKAYS